MHCGAAGFIGFEGEAPPTACFCFWTNGTRRRLALLSGNGGPLSVPPEVVKQFARNAQSVVNLDDALFAPFRVDAETLQFAPQQPSHFDSQHDVLERNADLELTEWVARHNRFVADLLASWPSEQRAGAAREVHA